NRQPDRRGTFTPLDQNGASMTVLIAGDVTDSTFSAAVDPAPSGLNNPGQFVTSSRAQFGNPSNIVLPRGAIHAKVEGTINNSGNDLVAPEASGMAFFAHSVELSRGPVIPPNVPEQPFGHPTVYHRGQLGLKNDRVRRSFDQVGPRAVTLADGHPI